MEQFQMDVAGDMLIIETGRLAKQAHGAVLVRIKDTAVLVTATVSKEPREGIDFFPLTVDYEERLYSVGKIPGGFIKREGRPTEKAILSARLIDRPIRPLFPKVFRNAVHVVATVLSVDQDCPPEIPALIGASAALSISKIPFLGPIAAVMVGMVDGQLVINPNQEESEKSSLKLIVAGTKDAIMMVEAGALELPEEKMLEAILFGHEEIKKIVQLQEEMVLKVGVEKMKHQEAQLDEAFENAVRGQVTEKLSGVLGIKDKIERETKVDEIRKEALLHFEEEYPEMERQISKLTETILKEETRKKIVHEGIRPDGRKTDEIRQITSEVGILPRTHGSGLFTRGQTQVLTVCTLGAMGDVQMLDGLGLEESKKFMHHYNFPPFSVGESGFMRGPGRREIGHGALAEKAILSLLPDEEDFPYTIRLVSEVLESNGSTSMGSVCASCLSLMDAGVPIKRMISGIAMGLIKEEDKVAVLSDIQGMEDFYGDMDFKVAGTREGITALQMDIKIKGVSREVLEVALKQGKAGYMFIMDKMAEVIPEPRGELSPYAPRIFTMHIHPDKIREVIGPGGKIINKIVSETGVKIDIENDGTIYIAAFDQEGGTKAREMIEALTKDVEAGVVYMGKVTRVEKYGAFMEVLPGKEGLCHISQLDLNRVAKTEDVVKVGDELLVKVLDIDDRGRINISRKAAMPGYDKEIHDKPREDRRTGGRPGGGSGGRSGPRSNQRR
ncbi:polyribonucleotide nucleotidyltransferase [Candidatus Contubernalis alkaliaceticus]|uniref:polyribonucleotide nucleotidyltransferase n=1 Tax=Candidatus Contubernalis alkaliaceticus TaxID=338645 RepID=UPI001F4BD53C|nr:polyribonucleotide nucleotidyltransferase [Candidatus Contubernalis alkalaceticus]UNC91843.1 polyribonucleotide nucleotidyltransferase [Candidatus Contubernalis alkalaceticus]